MELSGEDLRMMQRALEIFGGILDGWNADQVEPPYSQEAVDNLLERIREARKGGEGASSPRMKGAME